MLGAKSIVNTDEFGAWEAESHGIYSVFLPVVAKITLFTVSFTSGRAKTLVFTQVSACCMMSFRFLENAKTPYFTVFCFSGTEKRSQKALENGHFGVQVRAAQPSLTQLGAMLAHLGAMLAYLGAMLARLEAMLAHLGAMLAHLGAHVGPAWSYVGATWSSVGPTWPFFGAFVGPPGPILTELKPQQRTAWRATKHRKIQCFVGSGATMGYVGPQVHYLDARLPLDGAIFTSVGLVFTHVGRKLAHVGHMFAQLGRTVADGGRATGQDELSIHAVQRSLRPPSDEERQI